MGDKTGIEWTDATWNPIRGCSRVSEGCRNCYAESVANRFKGPGKPYEGLIAKGGQWNGQIKLVPEKLDQPLRWQKPRKIFVNSMSDLFHPGVPLDYVDQVFAIMAVAERHTFQVLTKRPKRMYHYLNDLTARRIKAAATDLKGWAVHGDFSLPLSNVWIGVSVEDQVTADERIPLLMKTPAAVRWISAEPLLGPVDLGMMAPCDHKRYACTDIGCWSGLDWVVVGGESGAGARSMQPDWVRSLRDQCIASKTPFLFKQWGEYAPEAGAMVRVGKKKAGNTLDGVVWLQEPGS